MAPLEKNPQIIMWDPEVYPEIETIADLGEAGVTINVFGGGGFSDYFVAAGIWSADQVDPSYDGQPGRFIAEGDIAQQGFASAEPYNYENDFEDWGRPVDFLLIQDSGWEIYSQALAVRTLDTELDDHRVLPLAHGSLRRGARRASRRRRSSGGCGPTRRPGRRGRPAREGPR